MFGESAIFGLVVVGAVLIFALTVAGTWWLLASIDVGIWSGVISLLGGIYVVSLALHKASEVGVWQVSSLTALLAAAGVIIGSLLFMAEEYLES